MCRTEKILSQDIKDKISLFCNVDKKSVIEERDVHRSIYELPIYLKKENLTTTILNKLSLKPKQKKLELEKKWQNIFQIIQSPSYECTIGVVGKYIDLQDAYKSIDEAIHHAGFANKAKIKLKRIDSEHITQDTIKEQTHHIDSILVPGGFGERGIEGKIEAIRYSRENHIPFLGICLGMQCAVIEFARHMCDLNNATSFEFNKETPYPVIALLDEQNNYTNKGGTMRLGNYTCKINKQSIAFNAYKQEIVQERHRHRYEFNNKYKDILESKGMSFSGINPATGLVEIIEIATHPCFIGVQFHPEFSSKPIKAHPLFNYFIEATINKKERN